MLSYSLSFLPKIFEKSGESDNDQSLLTFTASTLSSSNSFKHKFGEGDHNFLCYSTYELSKSQPEVYEYLCACMCVHAHNDNDAFELTLYSAKTWDFTHCSALSRPGSYSSISSLIIVCAILLFHPLPIQYMRLWHVSSHMFIFYMARFVPQLFTFHSFVIWHDGTFRPITFFFTFLFFLFSIFILFFIIIIIFFYFFFIYLYIKYKM